MNFKEELLKLNINLDEESELRFKTYYEFLTYYNEMVNLTAITDHDGVYMKHFYDSLILSQAFDLNQKLTLCDVGAGAGFPSVPNAIIFKDIDVTIIDALNKRITFLNELTKKLNINNVNPVHARAEEFAVKNRETFDLVTARAVARLNVLCELCLPLCKVGGYFLALKSLETSDELKEASVAIKTLGGEVLEVKDFTLPYDLGQRSVIIIKKVKPTPLKYPRVFAKIKAKPL